MGGPLYGLCRTMTVTCSVVLSALQTHKAVIDPDHLPGFPAMSLLVDVLHARLRLTAERAGLGAALAEEASAGG
ncbi:MAG: hypothetical protein IPO67_24150 [Deltaproteobacteria bacterium]|nr:hypothetical protein [Deltaproteobacteria bacterium]